MRQSPRLVSKLLKDEELVRNGLLLVMQQTQPPCCYVSVTDKEFEEQFPFLMQVLINGCYSPTNLTTALGILPTSRLRAPWLPIELDMNLGAQNELKLWRGIVSTGKPTRIKSMDCQRVQMVALFAETGIFPELMTIALKDQRGVVMAPRALLAFKSLQSLSINVTIGDKGMHQFSEMVSAEGESLWKLHELNFYANQISPEGMSSFMDVLTQPALANLTKLVIYFNHIGDEGMRRFAESLSKGALKDLNELSLNDNRIGDEGIRAFCGSLRDHGSLLHVLDLELDYNYIGKDGMREFSESVEQGALPHLTALSLNRNMIGKDGAKHLAKALSNGGLSKITSLSLKANAIGDEGFVQLCSSMSHQQLKVWRFDGG